MTEPERFALSTLAAISIPDPQERRATLQRLAAERRAEAARLNAKLATEELRFWEADLAFNQIRMARANRHDQGDQCGTKGRRLNLLRLGLQRRVMIARESYQFLTAALDLREAELTLAEAHLALAVEHERHVKQSAESPA